MAHSDILTDIYNKYTPHSSRDIQIVLTGDSAAGKSAHIRQFCEGTNGINGPTFATIGVDYGVSQYSFSNSNEDYVYRINFYDLSGKIYYKDIRKEFYNEGDVIVIAYDINKPHTAKNISQWVLEIKTYGYPNKTDKKGNIILLQTSPTLNKERIIQEEIEQSISIIEKQFGYNVHHLDINSNKTMEQIWETIFQIASKQRYG